MKKYPLKLKPALKDTLWGGDLLKRCYNKVSDYERIAESWELTVRDGAVNTIVNGEYAGMNLRDYLGESENPFPLLVKFLDAREKLSVQVHPTKTEMWYVVEAAEGAELVYGLNGSYTKNELREAIASGKLEECLSRIKVKAGEIYYIPVGLVHAIGAGILVAEIQQNDDTTYRFYDYNRRQKDGSLRELHVEKALEAMRDIQGIVKQSDEFFKVREYNIGGSFSMDSGERFSHLLCLDGSGAIDGEPVIKGDSYFIPESYGRFTVKSTASEKIRFLISKGA